MILCKFCGSDKMWKAGAPRRSGKKLQRWQCKDCGRYTTTPFIPVNKTKKELTRSVRKSVYTKEKGRTKMIEIWVDGLCEPVTPASARMACLGFVIKRDGETISEGSEVIGTGESMTNNVAEYTALIRALERIRRLRLDKEKIVLMSDSQLVIGQMSWGWKVKKEHLLPLYTKAKILAAEMDIAFKLVPREENEEADGLCWLAYRSQKT